jgi:hypothetical protein
MPLPGTELRVVGRRPHGVVTILTELSLLRRAHLGWSVGKVVECGSVGTRRCLVNSEKSLESPEQRKCRCVSCVVRLRAVSGPRSVNTDRAAILT